MNTTRSANPPIVAVEAATCRYGSFVAVTDVSFSVRPGQIHALLGTNGAGKTTLLETIQGFRRPASGTVAVFNVNPWKNRTSVAGRTGTMLQESGLVDEMTVLDQLTLWKHLSLRDDSVDRVLELVGLNHRRKIPVAVLSGGERRRLDFAMSIWGNPELIILDEPTTGLDPQSRRTMWSVIRNLNEHGATILLTTHYLDEAQNLADHVTILDRGRIAVEGVMSDVLAGIPARITFSVATDHAGVAELQRLITGSLNLPSSIEPAGREVLVSIQTPDLQRDVGAVIDWARGAGLLLQGFSCAPASLEEVFFDMPSVAMGSPAS